jgi:hypothetical protein
VSSIIQQGDCLLKKCGIKGVFEKEHAAIPTTAERVASNLVLKGQTNSHALYGGAFEILVDGGGTRFIRVTETATLDHVKDLITNTRAEHHAQTVPVGEYFVDQLNEYDHLLEESRKLID